jgi:hypothetical protein
MSRKMDTAAIEGEDLGGLLDLIQQLQKIDVKQLDAERETAVSPLDKLIRDLKTDKKLETRHLKGKTGVGRTPKKRKHSATCSGRCNGTCGTRHWTQKRKQQREYYHNVVRPKVRGKRAEALTSAEGWYKHSLWLWGRKKVEVKLTYEEYRDVLYPLFADRGLLPVMKRYRTDTAVSLDNLLMYSTDRELLFDGAEYKLRQLGCIL